MDDYNIRKELVQLRVEKKKWDETKGQLEREKSCNKRLREEVALVTCQRDVALRKINAMADREEEKAKKLLGQSLRKQINSIWASEEGLMATAAVPEGGGFEAQEKKREKQKEIEKEKEKRKKMKIDEDKKGREAIDGKRGAEERGSLLKRSRKASATAPGSGSASGSARKGLPDVKQRQKERKKVTKAEKRKAFVATDFEEEDEEDDDDEEEEMDNDDFSSESNESESSSPRGTKLLRPRPKDRRTSSIKRNFDEMAEKRREHGNKRTRKCSITACDKSVSPDRAEVGSVLCKFHKLWEHTYCLPENACNRTSNKQCFYCMQLKKGTRSLELEVTQDFGTYMAEDVVFKRGNGPFGGKSDWKFYWNLFRKVTDQDDGFNVKTGDYVFVKHKVSGGYKYIIFRVQFLVKDAEGKGWVSGYSLCLPNEVTSTKERIRFIREKERIIRLNSDGWFPISSVAGLCSCLYENDYRDGKPRGVKEENVFIIRFNFNEKKHKVAEVKEHNDDDGDYTACRDKLVFEPFEKPNVYDEQECKGSEVTVKDEKKLGAKVYKYVKYFVADPRFGEDPVDEDSLPYISTKRNVPVRGVTDFIH